MNTLHHEPIKCKKIKRRRTRKKGKNSQQTNKWHSIKIHLLYRLYTTHNIAGCLKNSM